MRYWNWSRARNFDRRMGLAVSYGLRATGYGLRATGYELRATS